MAEVGRGFYDAVNLVKDAVARVARARKIDIPVPTRAQDALRTRRWTNEDQRRVNKQNQDLLDGLRRRQQIARAERMAARASKNAVAPAPPESELQAALENANDVVARAVQERRTSKVMRPGIEALNQELAFYLDWLTQQEAATTFVPTKLAANPPRRGGRRKTPRRKLRNSTFRRHRKH